MIQGDSVEYEILKIACDSLTGDDLFTCEIGVRQGAGSKVILDAFKNKKHWHIGIDPYGNLNYEHYDNSGKYTCDYTNSMKLQLIKDLDYENFTLFSMGDDEFIKRFSDGVPIYRNEKQIINHYDLVHFDGPHKTFDVVKEAVFFAERSRPGTVFVFDDYPKYNMDTILRAIVDEFGFMLLKQGKNKLVLKRN